MNSIVDKTMGMGLFWMLVAAVAVLLMGVGVVMVWRARERERRRTGVLRRVFGPEYASVLAVHRQRARAEAELTARLHRRAEVWLRDLTGPEREHAEAAWDAAVALFVQSPEGALLQADVLVSEVMRGRGYPVERFEDRASLISLDHPDLAQHMRAAHRIATLAYEGKAPDTERMRQALVSYRHVFDALLEREDALSSDARAGGGDG
jgi:hypothetical protein